MVKQILMGVMIAIITTSTYAEQLLRLQGGLISKGTLVTATVSHIYSNGGDTELKVGSEISAGSQSFSGTCSDAKQLSDQIKAAYASGINIQAGDGYTIQPSRNTSVFNKGQSGLTLDQAIITCLKISSATIKGDTTKLLANPIEVDVQFGKLDDASVSSAEILTADISGGSAASTIKEDANISYVGDYIQLNVQTSGFTPVSGGVSITAPKHACFRVNADTSQGNPNGGKLYGSFVTESEMWFVKDWFTGDCGGVSQTEYGKLLGDEYVINKEILSTIYDRTRYGFTFGVMVTPFKFYPKQNHFESRATIGGYLGWRMHDRQGASNAIAIAIGPTTATVNNGNGAVSVAGASAAIAWLGDIKDSFSAGVLLGADYFSKAANVPYAGNAWIGVNLGYKIR